MAFPNLFSSLFLKKACLESCAIRLRHLIAFSTLSICWFHCCSTSFCHDFRMWPTTMLYSTINCTLVNSLWFFCCCSASQSWPTFCYIMDCSTPGFPFLQHIPELAQTHVHWVGDVIQWFLPLLSPSTSAFSLSQHQGLFPWVSSSHKVAKVLVFWLQYQSFQWIFRIDFL